MHYDPLNWYWVDETGLIYSSAEESLIDDKNVAYLNWIAGGNRATPWPFDDNGAQTNSSLLAVLSEYGLVIASSPLEAARQRRVVTLTAICGDRIISGFLSSALGTEHTYPSEMKDQINLMGSVTDSIMPELPADWRTPFWCRDGGGLWSWKMHDAVQIQQAGRDGKAHVVNCQTTLAVLNAQIAAANTVAAVNAIGWPH